MSELESDFDDELQGSDVDENFIGVSLNKLQETRNFLIFLFRSTLATETLVENAMELAKRFYQIEINMKATIVMV